VINFKLYDFGMKIAIEEEEHLNHSQQ